MAVLLPIAILAIAGAVVVSERYDAAQQASSVADKIATLDGLVNLRSLLDQERFTVEAASSAIRSDLGFDTPDFASADGFFTASEGAARSEVDAQLRLLGPVVPAGFQPGLAALRARIDRGRITTTPADLAFNRLSMLLMDVLSSRLSALQSETAKLSQAASLNRALNALSDASDALDAGGSEPSELIDVYLSGGAQRASALSALGGDIALFAQASARLGSDVGPARVVFAALERNTPWRAFQQAVVAAASGAPMPRSAAGSWITASALPSQFASLLPLADLFRSGMDGLSRLYGLVERAEHGARASASSLRASSAAALRTVLIETIIAVGLTIVIALALARSITRPLRRLEDHARAISNGELELPALSASGPKETAVVAEAVNDLVGNLRLMEEKARALARCAFEDPALAEPLPGRLGDALHESVARSVGLDS